MVKTKKKVVVAISGGVDSSSAAFLLKKAGYEVIGLFMRLSDKGQEGEEAARKVCQKLQIKFYPINLANKFRKEIINYFLSSYRKGLTPNPCIKCNQLIKFGELFKFVKLLGADCLATGHYVRLLREDTKYKLLKAKDKDKDQTYFLYTLKQDQLGQILFPLGNFTKKQVRIIADKAKLPYLKKESQDICFLSGEHNDFLKKYLKLKSGLIKTLPPNLPPARTSHEGGVKDGLSKIAPLSREVMKGRGDGLPAMLRNAKQAGGEGQTIGQHQGLPLYTIGQRKGVEIGGIGPFYVAKTDYKNNILYVVKNGNNPALFRNELIVKDVNWVAGKRPKLALNCLAVIRYRHPGVKCRITAKKGQILVKFREPQRAVTPGQSVVFYSGEEVLGGGIIS